MVDTVCSDEVWEDISIHEDTWDKMRCTKLLTDGGVWLYGSTYSILIVVKTVRLVRNWNDDWCRSNMWRWIFLSLFVFGIWSLFVKLHSNWYVSFTKNCNGVPKVRSTTDWFIFHDRLVWNSHCCGIIGAFIKFKVTKNHSRKKSRQ